MCSTLPRSKKEISYPLINGNNTCTTKEYMVNESNDRPATDHENFGDEVQFTFLMNSK